MKKITLLCLVLLPFTGFSQAVNQRIQTYLNSNHAEMGLTAQDVNGWIVESTANSTSTHIDNYYIKQCFNGIEIFNAVSNVWVKNGEVLNVGNRFVSNAAQKINTINPTLSVTEGLTAAFSSVGQTSGNFQILESMNPRNFRISNGNLTEDPVTAELVFQLIPNGSLNLAWDYTFYSQDLKHLWSIRIDAQTGNMLDRYDMIISCSFGEKPKQVKANYSAAFTNSFYKESKSLLDIQSGSYRVLPFYTESPGHGPRELLVTPHDAAASPFGWHDTNGATGMEYTITRGNNVLAQEDANANDGNGVRPDGGTALLFDYPYGGTTVSAATYRDAATTQLFYMNNAMHDVWWHYGFDESNGNFQQKNYSGFAQGGLTGDAVLADSQDGGGTNNANFGTPTDGQRPRMQMYLWDVSPSPFVINSPADMAGVVETQDNSFEPGHVEVPVTPGIIQSDLVLFNDGLPDNADACTAPINAAAINGHITIIRRGDCTFVEKTLFAQNAGATAVIIVNNVEGVIGMAGADASITIPVLLVTQAAGEAIIARMQTETVNAQLQRGPYVNSDGDFDNGVIAHEYGHGISTRLTGGAGNSNCLFHAEEAGEGWSDWFALMMQLKSTDVGEAARGIGTFVFAQEPTGTGIRSYPYSTDMSINPLTFSDSNYDESHMRGEFMAAVLWDLTWAYIDKYGFDTNVYSGTGGNNKVMQIVLDGLKLQPCSPTFVEYRNAVIAADQATTGGQDFCMIWDVFARRGMGVNASSGSRDSATDQVENFTVPAPGPNCSLAVNYFESNDMIRVYPNPSNGIFTIHISKFIGKANVQVIDINGRVVYSIQDDNFEVEKTIDVRHLQSGMYVLKVDGESLNYTKKIILN